MSILFTRIKLLLSSFLKSCEFFSPSILYCCFFLIISSGVIIAKGSSSFNRGTDDRLIGVFKVFGVDISENGVESPELLSSLPAFMCNLILELYGSWKSMNCDLGCSLPVSAPSGFLLCLLSDPYFFKFFNFT